MKRDELTTASWNGTVFPPITFRIVPETSASRTVTLTGPKAPAPKPQTQHQRLIQKRRESAKAQLEGKWEKR